MRKPEITIGRMRRDRGIYIGRPTALGNPFSVNDWGRERAIAMYRDWLPGMLYLKRDPRVRKQFASIVWASRKGPITLLCYCAPQACHGDVIGLFVEEVYYRAAHRG